MTFHFVVRMADVLDDCVEARLVVGVIFDHSFGSISFVQSVFSFDDISIAMLPVAVNITGLWIVDSVFELVGWVVMWLLAVLALASSVAGL